MFWNNPWAFLGLLAIPAVWFYFSRRTKRQNAEIKRLFSDVMLQKLFTPQSRLLKTLKNVALGLAAVAIVFVFAEPKRGLEKEARSSLGRDVFVLFDVSESMLAEDVAPNRLSVAKLDVEDLLNSLVGDRIGLIAFAGAPQVEIPLTTDYVFFRDLLREIDVSTARFGGTAIGDAVRLALKRFGDVPDRERSIILVTDGEDHESLPLEAARDAVELGVPIYAIAIGDLQGAPIPIFDVAGRRVGAKTFDGEKVLSKPDVATLKEMAKISGGRYYYADSNLNLAEVYRTSVDRQKRTALEEKNRVVLKDRYQPFLAVALFAFAFAYFLPTRWRRVRNSNSPKLTQISVFLLAFVFAVPFAFAQESTKSASEDDAEKSVTEKSDASIDETAQKDARSEEKLSKREAFDAYNRAVALYAEGKKEEAAAILSNLSDVSSVKVADRANFNLGALASAQALAQSKELVESVDKADKNKESSDQTTTDSQSGSSKPDFVAQYERERQKRDELRREIGSKAQEAQRRFRRANRDKNVASTARENAASTSAWLEKTRQNERERELKLRAEALPDPADRLRWLQEETARKIEKTQQLEKRSSQSSFYRDLFEEGRELADLETDVEDVATNLTAQIQTNSATQDARGDALNVGADPEEDARRVKEALAEFAKRRKEAAENFANYDVASGRKELRRAQTQLTALRDAPAQYDELAKNLAAQETEKSKTVSATKAAQFDDAQREDYYWKQDALNCSARELLRKAKKIAQDVPAPDARSTETNPSELEESSEKNEETTNENFAETAKDEIVFDDNLPEKSNNSSTSQQESEQEKIRRSAQIALESEQELLDLIEKSKKLVDKGKLSDADAKTLEETQKNIERITQEIVRPLQDQEQQNQQNQNNSDQSKSQDSKNSEKNQESKDRKDQDQQDEQNKSEQEKDESQKEEEKRQEPKQEKQNSATTSEKNPSQKEEKKAPEPEKTQAQKEADSFVRLVEQRQKEAEQIRRAIRTSQQRREKSGKDW